MSDIASNKRIYELGYHVLPTRSEDELAKVVEAIKSALAKAGAEIISEEYPKSMNLAYEVVKEIDNKNRGFDTAYFGWLKFEMETASLEEFKSYMEKNLSILRFILIKTVRESTLATIKLAQKHTARRQMPAPEEAVEMDTVAVDKKIDEMVEEDSATPDLK